MTDNGVHKSLKHDGKNLAVFPRLSTHIRLHRKEK
jgi:hypothetical protein